MTYHSHTPKVPVCFLFLSFPVLILPLVNLTLPFFLPVLQQAELNCITCGLKTISAHNVIDVIVLSTSFVVARLKKRDMVLVCGVPNAIYMRRELNV